MLFFWFLLITVSGLTVAALACLLWVVLHKVLCSKLDPLLFRRPYFQKTELANYRYWPLNILRSANYSYLIAFPSLAKRKRFAGFDEALQVGPILKLACRVHITLIFLGGIYFCVYFGYIGWALILYKG
jgi:hypothetical protein